MTSRQPGSSIYLSYHTPHIFLPFLFPHFLLSYSSLARRILMPIQCLCQFNVNVNLTDLMPVLMFQAHACPTGQSPTIKQLASNNGNDDTISPPHPLIHLTLFLLHVYITVSLSEKDKFTSVSTSDHASSNDFH